MKKLSSFAALAVVLLLLTLAFGLLSAQPSYAQGNRPATDVRVVNTPSEAVPVNVASLPAVQVSNLPPVPEPFHIRVTLAIPGDGFDDTENAYTVPEGKRLRIDYVNFICYNFQDHTVSVRFGSDSTFHFPAERRINDEEYGSEQTVMYGEPGQSVWVSVSRPTNSGDPNSAAFSYVNLTGVLMDAE